MSKNRDEQREIKGIKIKSSNACIMIAACILYVFLFYVTVDVAVQYEELMIHTQDYIASEKNAAMVTAASDYLTEQVRLYVQNMDIKYAELYFEEVNVTKRRENVLAELEAQHSDDALSASLETAIQCSNDLMVREIYAMKLVSVANNYDAQSLPIEIQEISLSPADSALDAEAMIDKARTLVFNEEYQEAKAQIYAYISHFTQGILEAVYLRQSNSADELFDAISIQRLFLGCLFLINVLTFVIIVCLVIKPIQIFLKCVKKQALFETTGAYEFNYLAQIYNDIYKKNELISANEAFLKHKAEHDPLTGIFNRNVFNQMSTLLEEKHSPLALLLIDVDDFKQINDSYGHVVGDQILEKIAAYLKDAFRTNDYLFRIGGDEFAAILTNISKEQAHMIEEKILKLNSVLQHPQDGLPAISLSVGVAFSDDGYQEKLYEQADQSLYLVKKQGRCGCHVYSETDKVYGEGEEKLLV